MSRIRVGWLSLLAVVCWLLLAGARPAVTGGTGVAGAKGIFVYMYHYFHGYPPEKMVAVSEELGGEWK